MTCIVLKYINLSHEKAVFLATILQVEAHEASKPYCDTTYINLDIEHPSFTFVLQFVKFAMQTRLRFVYNILISITFLN